MHMDRYINRQTHWDSTDENDDDAHGICLCMYIVSYLYRTHIYIYTIHTHDASIRFETQMNMFRWVHEEMGMEGGGRVGRGKFQGVELVEAGKGGCTMLVTRMIMMMMAPLRHRMGGGGYLQH